MKHSDFYIQAMALPLLQGISAEHILQMQERGVMRMVSMEPEEGEIIVQGQHCKTLTMLLQGVLTCNTNGDGWTLTEDIQAPAVIEEEALWSLSQKYNHTYRPKCNGRLLVIDRHNVMHTMMHNDIFRINLLTRMSSRLERAYIANTSPLPTMTREKINNFVRRISCTPDMPKTLSIKMTTLAEIIDETRLNVSTTLRQMQESGEISLAREQITFRKITS